MQGLIMGWLCCAMFRTMRGGVRIRSSARSPSENAHHALRNFRAFGGDDLSAYVENWMKEPETSCVPRYGRWITKQEVDVDVESSDSDTTPLAQRKRGQPSELKNKGPKRPQFGAKKGATPAVGSVLGSAGPVTLSAASVQNIVGALTENIASGLRRNVKDAVTSQTTSIVAAALREERRSEVAARLKRQEEKKRNGGQTEVGPC